MHRRRPTTLDLAQQFKWVDGPTCAICGLSSNVFVYTII